MKGIVFRVFLELLESKHGYQLVDEIIEESDLKSNGVYTSVGTYHHSELFQLANKVCQKTGVSEKELLCEFGKYTFTVFSESYNHLIKPYRNAYEFLERIEDTIHVEVFKLYPEAELPLFKIEKNDKNQMLLIYHSAKKMAYFAEGLIKGSLVYFENNADIIIEPLNEENSVVKFIIDKK